MLFESLWPIAALALVSWSAMLYCIGYDVGRDRGWNDAARIYAPDRSLFLSAFKKVRE